MSIRNLISQLLGLEFVQFYGLKINSRENLHIADAMNQSLQIFPKQPLFPTPALQALLQFPYPPFTENIAKLYQLNMIDDYKTPPSSLVFFTVG